MSASEPRQPWDRCPEESARAFAAFRAYLELGAGRSIPAAATAVKKSPQLLWRWSSRHHWGQRARAWDLENQRRDEAVVREQQDSLLRRRLQRAEMLARVGLAVLRGFVRRDPATGELQLSSDVKPRDAVPLLRLATELEERLDAGGAGRPEESKNDEQLHELDDRELAEFVALARERAGIKREEVDDNDSTAEDDEA